MKTKNLIQVVLLILAFSISSAVASPPTNDGFSSAHLISGNSGVLSGDTTEATRESGEPIHALNRGGASVWYKYVAPGNGVLRISTTESNFDTLLAVYTGTTLANLKTVTSMDNFSTDSTYGIVTIGTQINTTYYIAIDGHNEDGAGPAKGTLKLSWTFSNVSQGDNFASAHTMLDYKTGQRVESNVGASKQLGEPDHAGNVGGKSVWFRWTAPQDISRSYTFSTRTSVRAAGSGPMHTLLAIYSGADLSTLTPMGSGSGVGAKVIFTPTPGTTYSIAVDGYDFGQGADTGTINLSWRPTDSTKDLDFDLDGRTDITLFRPTNGVWYTLDSITHSLRAVQWGVNGDRPVPGRFDSDERLDYNVFRPDTATWWTLGSSTGATTFFWGVNTDMPFNFRSADSDYAGMFRQTTGTWYIYIGAGYSVNFGQDGDVPVPADYDGDGHDNIVVFRPVTGTWWTLNQITGQQTAEQFGVLGDKPVPADYDGDGRADIAVYRPSTGTWYAKRSSDGSVMIRKWGLSNDKPHPGDYDNDTLADLAVYRPSSGTWYVLRSSDGTARYIKFGLSTDEPLSYQGITEW